MISRYLAAIFAVLGLLCTPLAQAQGGGGKAAAAPQVFMTSPVGKPDGSRWRLGYVESGEYSEYPRTLDAIVEGLQRLGWLGLSEDMPAGMTGREMWSWLSRNVRSNHLEFVEDAWWQPGNFDAEQRAPMREAIMRRLNDKKDIDLIIAMGTWAGQDMRALGPPVPTIVGSASDPIAARISDSAADSGRDNLHARVEPERFQRQVRLFHGIVPFKKLGIVYEDSDAGRSYAAVDAVEQVAGELGFAVEHCHARSSSISTEAAIENALNCYRQLSNKVDAFYVTLHRGITSASIKDLAHILEKAKIPSFSMAGSQEVEQGILLSLARADVSYVGLFHAETIARILNGAKPRQLSQLWVDPPKIALNLGTARIIGFDPPVDILLAADEVYEKAP
ncbi:ABC transporter substrate-binding protein [Parapusillimonas granuli]|uniref:ABC transporter substrate-binding protein n=1 Tax=Parapusillimonas granuli TaxID=380911 RepID=A0A853G251_9BURK|nr:ABC transporter substrate binding protein [Parapusillimonas granuli]MBB5214731.1 ABC-type uncharacterized transport system substrate-binding protein [Parapusillimonas granuli]MEB2398021.1 ABC transporter substrate binding protein [Alcaligenaceae bacterium]NYT48861.1 hypothetical protein [Parapusillimonas granuli]